MVQVAGVDLLARGRWAAGLGLVLCVAPGCISAPGRDAVGESSSTESDSSAAPTTADSMSTPSTTPVDAGGDADTSTETQSTDQGSGMADVPPSTGPCGCSDDGGAVLGCDESVLTECRSDERCDPETFACVSGCGYAAEQQGSEGCEFFATYMDNARLSLDATYQGCFAAAVVNGWRERVDIDVRYGDADLDVETFAAVVGFGGALLPYDGEAGLGPGEVAWLFLSGPEGTNPNTAGCPMPSAQPTGVALPHTTGIGQSFEIRTSAPVSAFQFNPYGGGSTIGASLLLPTSVWGLEYLAFNAHDRSTFDDLLSLGSLNIVASEDDTSVTFTAAAAVAAGGAVPATAAGQTFEIMLHRGEHLQLSQRVELHGSVVVADKPVGFLAGHSCMFVPQGVNFCDHGEQMIPPVTALGHEYVGVAHRPRGNERAIYRVIGVVDGTALTWSESISGAPAQLNAGQVAQFSTSAAFVVASQDLEHPFVFLTYMSGSQWGDLSNAAQNDRRGDADMVVGISTAQYRRQYAFMVDATFPLGDLVVIRKRTDGEFFDVDLECTGAPLSGWTELGEDYAWMRLNLSAGASGTPPSCKAGYQQMHSAGDFAVYVWGWGSLALGHQNESYGFPAGMQVRPLNAVELSAD